MRIEADVSVSDIMTALEMAEAPEGYSASETVEIEVMIDDDEIEDYFTKDDQYIAADSATLGALLRQGEVMDLSAAIRRGDTKEAELLLDRMFADDTDVTEWVQRGRYSHKARRRETAEIRAAA